MSRIGPQLVFVGMLFACSRSDDANEVPAVAVGEDVAAVADEAAAPDWLMRRPGYMPCTIRETGGEGDFRQVWFHAYDKGGRLIRAHREPVGRGLEAKPPNRLDEWRSRYEYDGRGRLTRYTEVSLDRTKVLTDHQLSYEAKRVLIRGIDQESHDLTLREDGQVMGDVFSVLGQLGMSSFSFADENPFQQKLTFLAGELIVGQVLTTVSFGGALEKPLSTVAYDAPDGGISAIASEYSGWVFGYCQ